MSASFASAAWVDSLATALQGSAKVRTESMSWVFGPLLLVVDADAEHGLEATGIRIDLHEGSVDGVTLVSPQDERVLAPFSIGGSLARWKAAFAGSLDLVDAILESKLRVRGDLPTITRHRALLAAIAATGGEVETSWQDEQEPVGATAQA